MIVDFFGGAGSTLIGSERMGRNSRLMEIDPKYVDCIIVRWQEHTGKQATLEGDGRSYEEIANERQLVTA
jgi:DNA modification methylase